MFDFCVRPSIQPRCWCQKQPWTKMIFRLDGKTRSGRPGRSLRCKRKRKPNRCASERTAISSLVLALRMRRMFSLRRRREIVSTVFQTLSAGNFLSSQRSTSNWSAPVALRIWISNFCRLGRSRVRFRAPSLQTEQIAFRFPASSLPPMDLSMMCPIWRRVFLPSS